MTPTYTMQINGGEVSPCSDLGWSLESIARRNLAPDVLSLRRLHDGALSLVKDDVVVVYADGGRIFTGTAQQPRISIADNSTVTAQILGPWHVLNQTTFTRGQPRTAGSGATATASVSGGAVTSIAVGAGGSGYLYAYVVFSGGGGAGCAARVKVVGGVVTSITVTAGGSGFSTAPTVTVVGVTQLPPVLGDTFIVGPGDGVEIWNPSTEAWETPVGPTTYKWAREDDFGASPIELDLARYTGTRGLICDPDWNSAQIYRTVQTEVRELLDYVTQTRARLAVGDRPDLTPAFAVDLDGIETGLGATAAPKYRTWQDQKVGQLLTAVLALKPDVSAWFDYTQETPELFMRVASLETEVELTRGQEPLMTLDATPRTELLPAGIVIRWEYPDATPYDWRGYKIPAHTDKSPATVLPHEPGVITHTLDFVNDVATFKPDIAASLMESLGTLRASGSMTLGRMSLQEALAMRPGLCFRVPDDAMLADSQLLVQETTWNATTNQVQCALGYPRALDLQTTLDLRGYLTFTLQGSLTFLIPPPGP